MTTQPASESVSYRQVVGAYFTTVTEDRPYIGVTRVVYEIPGDRVVSVDVPDDDTRVGTVSLSEDGLVVLTFSHHNPAAAALALVIAIEGALAGTAGA